MEVLNGAQATFLRESHDLIDTLGGCFGYLRPGAGKTLCGFLLPAIIPTSNPYLVVPSALEKKTKSEYQKYGRHWRLPALSTVGYEYLSHPKQLNWFEEHKPTLVIFDESWFLANPACKVWKRFAKYWKKNQHVKAFFMSGSGAGRKIHEYWHYLRACLRKNLPLPLHPLESVKWGLAIDEKVQPWQRLDIGALDLLPGPSEEEEPDPIRRARLKYRIRLTSTPGVVSTLEDIPDVGLRIWAKTLTLPPEVVKMLRDMRKDYVTPGGDSFKLAVELWRHARALGTCMYQVWRPPPPAPWRKARKDWHGFAREKANRMGSIDSIVHVVEGIEAGEIDDGGLLAAWRAIEDQYDPKKHAVDVWCHDTVLDYAKEWLKENDGLVWTPYPIFGYRLSEATGVPYFREEACDDKGVLVDDFTGPKAIVSIDSCAVGHNLHHWNKNLIVCPPSTGKIWNQMLARTHREGQEAHEVTAEVILTSRESYKCLAQACRDADFDTETSGQPHRLSYATREFGDVEEMVADKTNEVWGQVGV